MIIFCRRKFTKKKRSAPRPRHLAQAARDIRNVFSPCQQRGQIQGFVFLARSKKRAQSVALQLPCKMFSLDLGAPGIFPRTEPVELHVGVPAQYDLCLNRQCFPRNGEHEPKISGAQPSHADSNHDGCHNTTIMCTSTLHHVQPCCIH